MASGISGFWIGSSQEEEHEADTCWMDGVQDIASSGLNEDIILEEHPDVGNSLNKKYVFK